MYSLASTLHVAFCYNLEILKFTAFLASNLILQYGKTNKIWQNSFIYLNFIHGAMFILEKSI